MTESGYPTRRLEAREAPQALNGAPAASPEIDVSIVMPCLNEEEAILGCVTEARAAIRALGLSGEIVVVDNGSTDNSARVAKAAGARVINEPSRGYGNACRRGLAEAQGRFLVMGDSDGTYDFSALPHFVKPLLNGADMVVGNRLNRQMESGAMPWLHRYIGNPFLTKTMNVLFRSDIDDAHCGLRSIKKAALDELTLTSPGMEFASEFLIEAVQHGVRIEQVPIQYRRRFGGQPKLRTFRDGLRHLRLMVGRKKSPSDARPRHPSNAGREFSVPLFATGGESIVDQPFFAGHEKLNSETNLNRANHGPYLSDQVDGT